MPIRIDSHHPSEAVVDAVISELAALSQGAENRQEVAERLVGFLYDAVCGAAADEPACVLVRCFQTCTYARLPLSYRDAADDLLSDIATTPDMRCLSLLATRGYRSLWNDPATSTGHRAIPLPSVEVVRKAPMIARLMEELHIPLEHVAAQAGSELLLEGMPEDFNIFHVADAQNSPYIPAQESFVIPFGVASVLGMGGVLPDGEVLAVVLFTRVPVSQETATRFLPIAAQIKAMMSPFEADNAFARHG